MVSVSSVQLTNVSTAESSLSTGGSGKERVRRHRSRTRVSPSSTAPDPEEPKGRSEAKVSIVEQRHALLPAGPKGVDASTSMAPPEIRSVKAQTYLQLEVGLLQRRRAMLSAVQKAREELGRLSANQMPPLLWQTRRNAQLSLEVPLGCECTPDERVVLSRVLWQEEKREEWLEQQAEECSSLLRRAEEKLEKLAGQETLKPTDSPGTSRMRRRRQSNVDWETKLSGGDMDDGDDGGVPGGKEVPIECGNPFKPFHRFLAKHLSTRSSTAMDSAANPRERVRRHDARTALLIAVLVLTAFPLPLVMRSYRGAYDSFLGIDSLAAADQTIEALICESGGNYSLARACVEQTYTLRQQERDAVEAEEMDRAYRRPRGVLLSVMQCCVALVPLAVTGLAPWTFWPLLQHNIDYIILSYLTRETQVLLVVLAQTIAVLVVFTNVVFLDSTGMHGDIERAYILMESWLTFCCILVLVGGDALHHKPFYTLAVIYTSVNFVLFLSFVSRRTFEIEREQTVLFTFPSTDFTIATQVTVQNVLELLDSATLTLLLTNYKDFLLAPRLTVWAPIKLTRHDLLNAIYLEKVRFAFFERNRLYRLLGLRTSAAEKEAQKEFHIDAEQLIHYVTVIQRRWRLKKARNQSGGCDAWKTGRDSKRRHTVGDVARTLVARRDGSTTRSVRFESDAVATSGAARSTAVDSRLSSTPRQDMQAGSQNAAVCDELRRMRDRRSEDRRSERRRSRKGDGGDTRRDSKQRRAPSLGEIATTVQPTQRRSTLNVFAGGNLRGLLRGSSKQLVVDASPLGSTSGSRARDEQWADEFAEASRSPSRSAGMRQSTRQSTRQLLRVDRRADRLYREINAVERSLSRFVQGDLLTDY